MAKSTRSTTNKKLLPGILPTSRKQNRKPKSNDPPANHVDQELDHEVVHQPQEGPTDTVQPAQSTQAKVDLLTGNEALDATCSPDPLDLVLQPKHFKFLQNYDGNPLNWDSYKFLLKAIIDSISLHTKPAVNLYRPTPYSATTESNIFTLLMTSLNDDSRRTILTSYENQGTKAFQHLDEKIKGTQKQRRNDTQHDFLNFRFNLGDDPYIYTTQLHDLQRRCEHFQLLCGGNSLNVLIDGQLDRLPVEYTHFRETLQNKYRDAGYPKDIAEFTRDFIEEADNKKRAANSKNLLQLHGLLILWPNLLVLLQATNPKIEGRDSRNSRTSKTSRTTTTNLNHLIITLLNSTHTRLTIGVIKELEVEVRQEDFIEGHPEQTTATTIPIREETTATTIPIREEVLKAHGGTTDLPSSATNVAETTT